METTFHVQNLLYTIINLTTSRYVTIGRYYRYRRKYKYDKKAKITAKVITEIT